MQLGHFEPASSKGEATPVRTFIFGGCVSRDTVEFAKHTDFKVLRYVARQSLLSVGSDAKSNIPDFKLKSSFQQRMLESDLSGNLMREISKKNGIDVFVWDLVVERTGVWEFPDGSIATNSAELRRLEGMPQILKKARKIPFGSAEHFQRWQGAAALFTEFLDFLGLKQKCLVLAPEWAEYRSDNKKTGRIRGLSASQYNEMFRRYYVVLERLGITVSRIDGTVADENHKWGNAPFHFTRSAYASMEYEIKKSVHQTRN